MTRKHRLLRKLAPGEIILVDDLNKEFGYSCSATLEALILCGLVHVDGWKDGDRSLGPQAVSITKPGKEELHDLNAERLAKLRHWAVTIAALTVSVLSLAISYRAKKQAQSEIIRVQLVETQATIGPSTTPVSHTATVRPSFPVFSTQMPGVSEIP